MKTILTQEQLQKRVREVARQITDDYRGRTPTVICVLENAFVFMADLVRGIDITIECQFLKPFFREKTENNIVTTEIFFTPEVDVAGKDVILVEGILQSGVTTEFLVRNLIARGAASVKVCVLLDRQMQRRVQIQPDYFAFLIDDAFLVGYGLGTQQLYRNLPYVAALPRDVR